MTSNLRDFRIYLKGEGNNDVITVTAASFKLEYANQRLRFDFFREDGKHANIYVRHGFVAIIVPAEGNDGANGGQVFRVTTKGGTHVNIRAAYFRIGADVVAFYDSQNKYLDDVYVLETEVVACVPLGTVPAEPPPFEGK